MLNIEHIVTLVLKHVKNAQKPVKCNAKNLKWLLRCDGHFYIRERLRIIADLPCTSQMTGILKGNKKGEISSELTSPGCGEYRGRTDDLLHAMQAL